MRRGCCGGEVWLLWMTDHCYLLLHLSIRLSPAQSWWPSMSVLTLLPLCAKCQAEVKIERCATETKQSISFPSMSQRWWLSRDTLPSLAVTARSHHKEKGLCRLRQILISREVNKVLPRKDLFDNALDFSRWNEQIPLSSISIMPPLDARQCFLVTQQ